MSQNVMKIPEDRARELARQRQSGAVPPPRKNLGHSPRTRAAAPEWGRRGLCGRCGDFQVSGERYAVEWAMVRDVSRFRQLAPVPCTPNFLIGVINLRGTIVSVMDLGRLFDLPEQGLRDRSTVLVIENGQGNMDVEVPFSTQRDEIGVLSRSFGRMCEFLKEMSRQAAAIAAGDLTGKVTPQSEKDRLGHAIATMVENLRNRLGQIREATNVLASSASEILAGTTQLSATTTETGTAMTQTTSTIEEVRQTAESSNERARQVAEDPRATLEVAQGDKASIERVLQSMARIQEQMEAIGESIMKLSEQSQAIGDIITTVNDIAEQSNLLAVNTFIEAAKAGEHGKGFAVVAQEVRNLAIQSKESTKRVREILGDIHKSTTQAVMRGEQGTKAVEAGGEESARTREAIEGLNPAWKMPPDLPARSPRPPSSSWRGWSKSCRPWVPSGKPAPRTSAP